jgi:molybdenum cofactor cytidylyltransferase
MSKIAAVVLAAGGSSRLGRPKQLLTWRGETLIRRAVRAAAEAGCDPVIVVVGETADALKTVPPVAVVQNAEWKNGLGTSIRHGLEELGESVEAVVLLTCDQPFVDAAIIRTLIAERERTGKAIVASSYANTLGVPALFDRSVFGELRALPDRSGAKSIIETRREETASIPFEQGAIDIDTPEDFERLKENRD